MNFALVRNQYAQTQNQSDLALDNPHGRITRVFQSLLLDLNVLAGDYPEIRANKSRSKALTAIYILQESLDFEQNQELSQNLYSLYEFMRVSILNYREKPYDISTSRDITSELLTSWAELASDG